jgi:hypothetical protein
MLIHWDFLFSPIFEFKKGYYVQKATSNIHFIPDNRFTCPKCT